LHKLIISVSLDVSTISIGHMSKCPGVQVSVHAWKPYATYDKTDENDQIEI
jgi:hypothetical protein